MLGVPAGILAVWCFSMIAAFILIGTSFYVVSLLFDLENDYLNPTDLCKKVNRFVIPEYAVQFIITCLFLGVGDWIPIAINLPVFFWHLYKFANSQHQLETTTVVTNMPQHKKEGVFKLLYYIGCFLYYFYHFMLKYVVHVVSTRLPRIM